MIASPEQAVWKTMIARCHNPNNKSYCNYGARGISVCRRWRNSFDNFIKDMGPRPPGMTLDRKNNRLGYSPKNCRWASWKQQQRNRTNNRIICYRGTKKPLSEWAEIAGISASTFRSRMTYGWSVERIMTESVSPKDQSWRKK